MRFHVGLVGGGNITETHARAVQAIPGAEVVAVYGVNSIKVARIAEQFGGKAYTDYEAFQAHRPMEMVAIGSPSGLHAQHGIAAARRGIHVLTEKPLEINLERADAFITEAESAGVKLGVMFQDRVKPGIRRLRELIASGALGKILYADARVKWFRPAEYYSGSRWRGTLVLDGGGALINQAVHTVDLLLWLLGDVNRVQARTTTAFHKIEAEDTALAILEFASGALGTLQATTAAYPGYPRRVEITGTQGTVILEHDRIVSADLRNSPAGFDLDCESDRNPSASSATVSDCRGHQALFEDFFSAMNSGGEPVCNGREGRRSVALVDAIYRAAKSKTSIQI
jgi:predicted dehydrogenase